MNILENRADRFIILENNKVKVIPKNPYTILKYERFNGNRIMYKIDDNNEISETYDNGIFNCKVNGYMMQIRDYIQLSEAVLSYDLTNNLGFYHTVCSGILNKAFDINTLRGYLNGYLERLEFINNEIIIDNFFKVDKNGSAYFLTDKGLWNYLCIVPLGDHQFNNGNINNGHTIEKNGLIDLSIIVLSKIMYLFNPDLSDNVLTRQLPEYILTELKRDDLKRDIKK